MDAWLVQRGSTCGAFLVGCALLLGCSGEGAGSPVAESPGAPSGPSYHADIKPILDQKCNGCHGEGGIASFSLTSFGEAHALKDAIAAAVSSGTMPPWPPEKDCAEYVGDRSLSEEQKEALLAWVAAGGPEGDPRLAPNDTETQVEALSRIDHVISLPEPYTPVLSPDDYRCFVLDFPVTETTYVTGFGVDPGAPAMVHHVIAYLAKPSEIARYKALDEADPGPGYSCFGGPNGGEAGQIGSGFGWVGGWAPGGRGKDLPPGTGIEIPAGSKLVVQVHYNTTSVEPSADLTKILIKADAQVEKRAAVIPFSNPTWVTSRTMVIPAHSTDVKASVSFDLSPYFSLVSQGAIESDKPVTLHSASLHMHTRGTRGITKILRKDGGEECLLQIDRWNFHWQGSYGFREPKQLNPGDQLYLECRFDNHEAHDLNWGEGTGDEMCLGNYLVTQ